MNEHGGDDAPPLALDQHRPSVIRAPVHQLIDVWAGRADVVRDHHKKNQAIDSHQ
jgi:hypothetical protein